MAMEFNATTPFVDGETTSPKQGLSRRALLKLAGVGLGTIAMAQALAALPAEAASTFIKGADISWLPQMEANGYIFKIPVVYNRIY